ncbi:hypothetical protein [Arenibaculum sp.]|jgi:3-oxoacyl-[acyl-carrier-protein] synthase-3|uniref:hypothetical protein n=1 Tax=Arenibaculum sp. TaxID=2865862 RepID=UPI002E1676EA|nr:hypothetical protein [Arenibaculum sp.]
MPPVTLSGTATSTGRSLPIEEAARKPGDAAAIAALREDGFDRFVAAERTVVDLVAEAIEKGLERNHLLAEDVDAVVFSTESFWDTGVERSADTLPEGRRIRDGLFEAMSRLGLRNAYPYASWLSSCANLGPALVLAKSLVETGQHARVLVALADRQPAALGPLMDNGASVYSDLAVCCTLDRRDAGYRVERVVSHASPGLATLRAPDAGPNFVLETNRAVKALGRKFRAATGKGCDAYRLVLTNNYNLHSLKIICDALGIDGAAVRRDTRADIAHGNASDPLVTLDHLTQADAVADGEEVLLLSTGVYCWSLVVLRRAAPSKVRP